MPTTSTTELVARLLAPVDEHLSEPDEDEKRVVALISETEALPDLPAAVRREICGSLSKQRKTIKAARLAAIGAELKRQLKSRYGLCIEFRVAQRRKRSPGPGSQPKDQAERETSPQDAVGDTTSPSTATSATSRPRRGLFGGKEAAG